MNQMRELITPMTDDDYKKLMSDLGMPNSKSLLSALKQVANHTAQYTLQQSAAVPVVGEVVALLAEVHFRFLQKGRVTVVKPNRPELVEEDDIALYRKPTTSITAAELDALRKDAASNADRDIAVMRASIVSYKEGKNGIERHPGNTAHENAAWEWGRKDGGWDGKH